MSESEVPLDHSNLLDGIRLMDIFIALQRKLVGDKVTPVVATSLSSVKTMPVGTTGAVLEFPNGEYLDALVITGLNTGQQIYRIKIDDSISGRALKTGKPVVVNAIADEPNSRELEIVRTFGINSMCALPIIFHGQILAILTVYSPVEDSFDIESIQAIKVMANLLGAILGSKVEASLEGPSIEQEDILPTYKGSDQ